MSQLEDEDRPEYWTEPRITANANLLAGMLAAGVQLPYRLADLSNPLEIKIGNANRYRVTVEQISGDE